MNPAIPVIIGGVLLLFLVLFLFTLYAMCRKAGEADEANPNLEENKLLIDNHYK